MSDEELDQTINKFRADLKEARKIIDTTRKALQESVEKRRKDQEMLDNIKKTVQDGHSDSETLVAKIQKMFSD